MYMCVYTKGNIFALCTICEGEQDCTHEMYIFRHSPRITLLIRDDVEVTSIYICIHICTKKKKKTLLNMKMWNESWLQENLAPMTYKQV